MFVCFGLTEKRDRLEHKVKLFFSSRTFYAQSGFNSSPETCKAGGFFAQTVRFQIWHRLGRDVAISCLSRRDLRVSHIPVKDLIAFIDLHLLKMTIKILNQFIKERNSLDFLAKLYILCHKKK